MENHIYLPDAEKEKIGEREEKRTLGERLADLRKKKGLSQTQVGRKICVSKQNISDYERDYRAPNYEILKDLSKLYDVSTDYLLGIKKENEIPVDISLLTESQGALVRALTEEFEKANKR